MMKTVSCSTGLLIYQSFLLLTGANKDVISKDGETALSQAQRAGHTDIAALLSEGNTFCFISCLQSVSFFDARTCH